MRKILTVLFLLFSMPVWAESRDEYFDKYMESYTREQTRIIVNKYRDAVRKCEKDQEEYSLKEENFSTIRMSEGVWAMANCYKSVAFDIIDNYYEKDYKDEMKQSFETAMSSISKLNANIYNNSIACPCGTIMLNMSVGATANIIKELTYNLIDSLMQNGIISHEEYLKLID